MKFEFSAFKAGVPAELRCALYETKHQCLGFGVKETAVVAHKRDD